MSPRCAHPVRPLNLELKRQHRLRLAGTLVAAPLVVAVAQRTASHVEGAATLRAAGAAIVAAALAIRFWALGTIDGRKKRELVRWGPYRHVRHPLYCSSLLLLVGFAVHAAAPAAATLGACLFVALYWRPTRIEEAFLAEKFGVAWSDYCREVPAFLPRLTGAPTGEGSDFRLRRPLRDLSSLVALAIAVFLSAELVRRWHDGSCAIHGAAVSELRGGLGTAPRAAVADRR